jgi:hypothetical protein
MQSEVKKLQTWKTKNVWRDFTHESQMDGCMFKVLLKKLKLKLKLMSEINFGLSPIFFRQKIGFPHDKGTSIHALN